MASPTGFEPVLPT